LANPAISSNLAQIDSGKKIFVGCYDKTPKGKPIPEGTIAGIFAFVTDKKDPEKEEKPIWQLFYGPIRIFWKGAWTEYNQDFIATYHQDLEIPAKSNDDRVDAFKSNLLFSKDAKSLNLKNREKGKEIDDFLNESFANLKLDKLEYYPVYGISNPDTTRNLPKERSPKAAVTGDYDIFCYWPLKGSDLTEKDFQRQADKNFPTNDSKYFRSLKPMTLKINLEEQVTPYLDRVHSSL
jgi:hypothetical protein